METIDKGFKNGLMAVTYWSGNGRPYILVKDLTDQYNDPTAYTRKIRGIDKAWNCIVEMCNDESVNEGIKFSTIINILDSRFKLDTHYYCAMD